MKNEQRNWWAAGLLAVLAVLATAVIPVLMGFGLGSVDLKTPEVILPILVISGTIGLLTVISIVVAVFAALNLSGVAHALGLPEGSVRAVIALSLILIFVIMASFLYEQLDDIRTFPHEGISQEQLNALPMEQIISIKPSAVGEGLFDAVQRVEKPRASEDFAKQVLTTISTLVVAIAGFYFGTRAVAVARGAVEKPKLRILGPDSPAPMPKEGEKLSIKIETTPEGEAVTWEIQGDDEGALVQVKPDEFEYMRGPKPEDTVALKFALRKHPEVPAEELKVEKPPEKPQPTG